MRVFLEERDNLHIRNHLESLPNCELIDIGEYHLSNLLERLLDYKIDIVVQIAPQWEWGRYVEEISKSLMNSNIKILAGEGAMFRWLGQQDECGADVGFYLSPWGYSGNSKLSTSLPEYNSKDLSLAKKILDSTHKWNKNDNNGKILVSGQLENDRSRMYCKHISTNQELINTVLKIYPPEIVVFRKHPLDKNTYEFLGIEIDDNVAPIVEFVNEYMGFVSINSTSTIEAMCCNVPIHNFETSPWFSCKSISKGYSIELKHYQRNVYEEDIASILHMHYIAKYNHGSPFINALNFYSEYSEENFNFDCSKRNSFMPIKWKEETRFNKY